MNKEIYNEIIEELQKLGRPDFEIEEIGYFFNELLILKKEKMPTDDIIEEINRFQRIVIENNPNEEDKEEIYEDINRKKMKKEELIKFMKEESYLTSEDMDSLEENIEEYLDANEAITLSELDLYEYNEANFNKSLQAEKKANGYTEYNYVPYLVEKLEKND